MTCLKHPLSGGLSSPARSRAPKRRLPFLPCLGAALALHLCAAGTTFGDASSRSARAAPRRIVSLNPCIDAILVELAPLERIAALSHYSRDPEQSTIAPLARRLPVTFETAEEVVALRPDLVLMSRHSAIATRNSLRRVGIHYKLFDVAFSIAESLEQIRRIAALVGRENEGAALVSRIERALREARPPAGAPRVTAAVYQPGGLTAGVHTVTDELMQAVGLENVPARYDVQAHQPLPLELLIAASPDVLLVGHFSADDPLHAARIVHHRALRALQLKRERFPARLLYCSGPTMIDALTALVAARDNAYARMRAAGTP